MPDSLRVFGEVPGHPELFLAFGNGHFGMTSGQPSGRLVAAMVLGRDRRIDPIRITLPAPGGSGIFGYRREPDEQGRIREAPLDKMEEAEQPYEDLITRERLGCDYCRCGKFIGGHGYP